MSKTKATVRRRVGRAFAAALAAVLVVTVAHAGETKEDSSDKKSEKTEASEPRVYGNEDLPKAGRSRAYTNEDLERLTGTDEAVSAAVEETPRPGPPRDASGQPKTPPPPPSTTTAPADPLTQLMDQQKAADERRQQVALKEAELEAERAKLKNLEVALLAARNPFSARPQLSEEEKEYRLTTGESAEERFGRTKREVAEQRSKVAALEAELAQLKR